MNRVPGLVNSASARIVQLLLACVLVVALTTESSGQECPKLESAFGEPAEGLDSIVVSVHGGRPYFKAKTSIDSAGLALYQADASHPEDTSAVTLEASLFTRFSMEAQLAVEVDRSRLESEPPDTSTLEGLLEAVRRGTVGCTAGQDGVDWNVSLYVAGEATDYTCARFELAEFARRFLEVVSNAATGGGRRLCP